MEFVRSETRRPGRPPKSRLPKPSPLVWGNDAHYRFKRELDNVVPAGDSVTCPLVLQRDLLPHWPPPPTPHDPRGHTCLSDPPLPPCELCYARRRMVADLASRWNLTFAGRPTQWATAWFCDALDFWQSEKASADHTFRLAMPVVTRSTFTASILVGTSDMPPHSSDAVHGTCPHCGRSETRGWKIPVPGAPQNGDAKAWDAWCKDAVSIIQGIASEQKRLARARRAAEKEEPYPLDLHLRLFAWYQVAGLTRGEAIRRCGVAMDPSHASRIIGEAARVLGVTRRPGQSRPRRRA